MVPGMVDSGALLGAALPVAVALLTLAWRLGGLERSVKDVQNDVQEMKGQIRDLSPPGKV
jgi:hypothetical protein